MKAQLDYGDRSLQHLAILGVSVETFDKKWTKVIEDTMLMWCSVSAWAPPIGGRKKA